jgi:predicted aldo/keto reductase-like oxidoreductase
VDLLMFPINLAGHALPGKKELFEACAAHNVALVAMKPYAGGKLLQQAPSISMENWQTGGGDLTLQKTVAITPAQCLAYVMAQPGLSTIVPGCKDVAQLHAALAYFQASEEERDFSAVMSSFHTLCRRRVRLLQPLPALSVVH